MALHRPVGDVPHQAPDRDRATGRIGGDGSRPDLDLRPRRPCGGANQLPAQGTAPELVQDTGTRGRRAAVLARRTQVQLVGENCLRSPPAFTKDRTPPPVRFGSASPVPRREKRVKERPLATVRGSKVGLKRRLPGSYPNTIGITGRMPPKHSLN